MAQRGLIFLSVVSQSIYLKFYSAKLVLRRAIEPQTLALGFDLKTLLNTPGISLAIQLGYKDSMFTIPPENPVSHF
jgi:hypothetical protein